MTMTTNSSRRRPRSWGYRHAASVLLAAAIGVSPVVVHAFVPSSTSFRLTSSYVTAPKVTAGVQNRPFSSSTALPVWWFGGTGEKEALDEDADSCELVAVRIERPSSNSRRIYGEIAVEATLEDCWAILTDYNRLAIHVPNLVESKITATKSGGQQGDGNFQCRLYQKGAQKIIGFEFGADVTMDMAEKVLVAANSSIHQPSSDLRRAQIFPQERKIDFRCVDSFFFKEFDGEWKVKEMLSDTPGDPPQTMLSYTVDVRPNGPVPVAALEWRIREDVPTNLRAVKRAAVAVGAAGVLASKAPPSRTRSVPERNSKTASQKRRQQVRQQVQELVGRGAAKLAPANVNWADDETLSKYLE